MHKNLIAYFPIALLLTAGIAHAGPAMDMAKARIDTIAKGDVASITKDYGANASLDWIGGPLDGTYSTPENITAVWTKFSAAQGPQKATIGDVWEAMNPKGSTVAANVVFEGKNKVPVLYIVTYRDGKLVGETWQVNPPAK